MSTTIEIGAHDIKIEGRSANDKNTHFESIDGIDEKSDRTDS